MRRAAAVALLALTGCGESTLIRSHPPGATVWINDSLVGKTPVEYSCDRASFSHAQRYRLELDGYQTSEGELSKRVKPGRLVGAYFSAGISLIFKRPTGFRDRYDFAL
ncbi:MAG TPA: PEGA domain-containing protein, partial [Candidatus Binatus sp.]|nr:PEGA domain-containing protein [Candidatus Binatus sp.]